ncbi:butyrate kinase [Christensenellaceae bacterium OttesenSCG-928-L17]|nr:butyrate kinase [Christensenellaceae bacterium OttesenSCG-928-L17]
MQNKILVINPGSTSTKIAIYEETTQLWQENIVHEADVLRSFPTMFSQLDMRLDLVLQAVQAHGDELSDLMAVSARGGLLPSVSSGAYVVNDLMIEVLEHRPVVLHASNLGAAIAYRIAKPLHINAYIYDPVTVDEMTEIARITGLKEVRRAGRGHNLNMRAAALKYCKENGLAYADTNIIVAHLGGGISVSLHSGGRTVDLISDDEGAFSPERAGLIPSYKLLEVSEGVSRADMMKRLQRSGGLVSHFGTADARTVENMANEGDEYAALVYDAMALGVARDIGKISVLVDGNIDAIVLTGGIAHSKTFTSKIQKRVSFIAPVTIIPGENEMQALADGAWRVLNNLEAAREYTE